MRAKEKPLTARRSSPDGVCQSDTDAISAAPLDGGAPSDGATPKSGQTVQVDYVGWLDNFDVELSKFTSSYARGSPTSFVLGTGRVIKGWEEALLTAGGGMKVGATRRLIVPPELGYGQRGSGRRSEWRAAIPPASTLYFEITLVGVQ